MNKLKKQEMSDILNSKDYGISETVGIPGILARLWRTVLMQLNVTPTKFDSLLYDASKTAKSRSIVSSTISKYFTVGNLRRELEKPTMTFKVFMKGIRLLKPTKVEFGIALHWDKKHQPVTKHVVVIDLGKENTNWILDDDLTTDYEPLPENQMDLFAGAEPSNE